MIKLEINNQTKTRVFTSKIKKAAQLANRQLKIKKNYNLSVGFVGKNEIKRLNKEYRKKDKVTDVLSFAGEDNLLGEIIICLPIAKKQAKELNHSFHFELQFLFIHGLLHLLGYSHSKVEQKRKMQKAQKKIMEKL